MKNENFSKEERKVIADCLRYVRHLIKFNRILTENR